MEITFTKKSVRKACKMQEGRKSTRKAMKILRKIGEKGKQRTALYPACDFVLHLVGWGIVEAEEAAVIMWKASKHNTEAKAKEKKVVEHSA